MASITCEDGRSMLSTSVGFGSLAEARGGAAEDDGGMARSGGVADVAREVQSQSEAGFAAVKLILRFWVSLEY